MLIFGTRSKILDGPPVRGQSCSNCGQGEYLSFGAARYFHIFWIPVLPFSRTIGVQCAHCKHTVTDKEVPEVFQEPVKSATFTKNRILPLFTGSVLIAGLIAFGAYSAQQDSVLELEYIQNPVASDVYIMDFSQVFDGTDSNYKFGVMRVEAVDDSFVELSVSNYGYDRASIPVSDLRRDMAGDEFFAEQTLSIEREDLIAMQQSNVIRDIRR